MRRTLATGEEVADCFGANNARSLVTRPLQGAELAITHLSRDYDEDDPPVVLPSDDAFLVVLYLIDVEHRDLFPDRPAAPLKRYPKDSICLISLKQGAAIAIRGRFEAIVFHIPRQNLIELTERAGQPPVDDLATCRGIEDQTIADLGAALIPLCHSSGGAERHSLPHIALAFCAHIAHQYGRSARPN